MPTNDTPSDASITAWYNKLNLHGEFLALGCIACFSAPAGLDVFFVVAILFIFFAKIRADSKIFPESARALRERVKSGEPSEEDRAMLAGLDARFFTFAVARRDVPIYCIALVVFVLTCVGLALRDLDLLQPHRVPVTHDHALR